MKPRALLPAVVLCAAAAWAAAAEPETRVEDVYARPGPGPGLGQGPGGKPTDVYAQPGKKEKPKRRARVRAPGAGPAAPEQPASEAADEGTLAPAAVSETGRKAEKMAEVLKSSLRAPQDAAPGASGPAPARPVAPAATRELALAASAGYRETFERLGLKVVGGEIARQDGARAGPAELETLRRALDAEPRALNKRPDFFSVLPRADFEALKSAYRAQPERADQAFKHIRLSTDDRDFQWSTSCDRLSGDCNPYARAMSYRRGEEVPPEDLSEVWRAARPEPTERARRARAKLARGLFAPGQARSFIGRVFDALSSVFGGGGAAPAPRVEAGSGGSSAPLEYSTVEKGAAREPPLPVPAPAPARRWGLWLLLAALLVLGWRKLGRKNMQ